MAPRNPEQEKEILTWIGAVMGAPLPEGDFAEVLKNGVILCQFMNKIQEGSVKKFKEKVGDCSPTHNHDPPGPGLPPHGERANLPGRG